MGFYGGYYGGFPPYVPVAQRREQAAKKLAALRRKGLVVEPVTLEGRTIAREVWGKSWCAHLESYADFYSRLERGRTYVRNGSVVHLCVKPGKVDALVSGSEVYTVKATVKPLPPARWKALCTGCAGQVASVVELLSGRLPAALLERLCDRKKGLFPSPDEIDFDCSCPDWAGMCKHVAAVLYGVGARLDRSPELLFTLRQVDSSALVSRAAKGLAKKGKAPRAKLAAQGKALEGLFGIELAPGPEAAPKRTGARKKAVRRAAPQPRSAQRLSRSR
ncbi:hypothetical protein FGE12_20350 [Aggregicoccus sp. 17bor-14]|uniref:SWIM zinc finger family protein n=1 Tax=Myxococcaceae TaxID=31 RepID=UPI00129C549F|nr:MULTISPECIES: SWIM zinc finger family protein [Myxococcaceae]MBF5044761.1 SWIM zinc finger family protein [Simulacricoccus sp. 17bor-14]MRI90505.1 hypothetical protein [Aggregicoccus sp. 17bor-14]